MQEKVCASRQNFYVSSFNDEQFISKIGTMGNKIFSASIENPQPEVTEKESEPAEANNAFENQFC